MKKICLGKATKILTIAAFCAVFSFLNSDFTSAATYPTFTDDDGVTWAYNIDESDPEEPVLSISFSAAPSSVTSVKIPSLNSVKSLINNPTINNIDTYFVDNLEDENVTVVAPTTLTEVDMSDASKVQIRNLSPLLNGNTNLINLVFGNGVVIADNSEVESYYCGYDFDTDTSLYCDRYIYHEGVFEGLNIKLTSLQNVSYIGWNAFKGATFDSTSQSVEITSAQTIGGHVFENTNLISLTINTEEVGEAVCKDCSNLTSLTLGDEVKTLYSSVFQNASNLNLAFDSKNIEYIGGFAFDNSGVNSVTFRASLATIDELAFANNSIEAVDFSESTPKVGLLAFYNNKISSLDLGNLTDINVGAFAKNEITELYLPKSIHKVGAAIFAGNPLVKITMAYDPLTLRAFDYDGSAASMPFRVLISGASGSVSGSTVGINISGLLPNPQSTIKELHIVAPYGENDTIPERVTPVGSNTYEQNILSTAKNVIVSNYFEDFGPYLETIEIGEGFEFIDSQAFAMMYSSVGFGGSSTGMITRKDEHGTEPSTLILPSTLRGIARNAFMWTLNSPDLVLENLPQNLEYIGTNAFAFNTSLTINNFNLPKLKYVGPLAFYGVKIKNITIGDSIEAIEHAAFVGNYDLDTITFDTDIFGKKNGSDILRGRFNDVFIGTLYTNYGLTSPDSLRGTYDNYGDCLRYSYHQSKMTFTNKAVTPPKGDDGTFRLYVDEIDISKTSWESIPRHTFYGAKIKTLLLPDTITEIGDEAFMRAEIENPLVLPPNLRVIGQRAFWGATVSDDNRVTSTDAPVDPDKIKVQITSLPESIEEIGGYAFYAQSGFTTDLDLPNLKKLGDQAFYGSNIRNITLPNTLELLGMEVANNTPALNNVTIDVNLYDQDIAVYTVPSTYSTFIWSFGDGRHKLGTITFTENAGQPFGGFANYSNDYSTPSLACNNVSECGKDYAYFYGIEAEKIDLGATNWTTAGPSMFQTATVDELVLPNGLTRIANDTFYQADLGDVTLPSGLKIIDEEGFQWTTAQINTLPEGLTTINRSAFYGADVTDNLVIPSTVTMLGQSAFNAGDEDVHYDTITLKPSLTFTNTDNQLMHQLFWNADVDKMIIESANLPALDANVDAGYQEFYSMPFDEVVIKNLPGISYGAFENCDNLTKVDLLSDGALRRIGTEAFLNDSKLNQIYFSPNIKNETITIGQNAFKGTAFTTMGDSSTEFDLTAALFDGSEGYAFAGMPKLVSVDIPRTFSGATIPRATFYNDTELKEATLDYKITDMKNAAFSNDNKLERIFIWGNTYVEDKNIGGYTEPTRAPDDTVGPDFGPTIPEPTDIYAYSVSPTEAYAGYDGRDDFNGTFYPLDEVLYITSNKPRVLINEEGDDFDKDDVIIYAMRRDGLILESDDWSEYDGVVYPRSARAITFEHMAQTIEDRPAFGTIWDTPVPIDELDFGNENFTEIDFDLIADPDDGNVRIVNVIYTDLYTRGIPDTDIDPYRPGEDDGGKNPDSPNTSTGAVIEYYVAGLCAAGSLLGIYFLVKKKD